MLWKPRVVIRREPFSTPVTVDPRTHRLVLVEGCFRLCFFFLSIHLCHHNEHHKWDYFRLRVLLFEGGFCDSDRSSRTTAANASGFTPCSQSFIRILSTSRSRPLDAKTEHSPVVRRTLTEKPHHSQSFLPTEIRSYIQAAESRGLSRK